MIVGVLATKTPDRINRVVHARGCTIHFRFGNGRNEAFVIGTGENHHRVAMHKRRQRKLGLVRRSRRRNEINGVEMKSPLGRLRYGDMSGVNRIEGAAKKCDRPAMRVP